MFKHGPKGRGGGNFFSQLAIRKLNCSDVRWETCQPVDTEYKWTGGTYWVKVCGKVGILLGPDCAQWCAVTVEDFGTKRCSLGRVAASLSMSLVSVLGHGHHTRLLQSKQGFGVGRRRKGGLCPPRSLSTPNI